MVVWRCLLSLHTLPRNIYPACQSFSKHLSSLEIPSTRFILSLSSYLISLVFYSSFSPHLPIFFSSSPFLFSSYYFVPFLVSAFLFPSLFLLPLLYLYYLHIILSFPYFTPSLLNQIRFSSLFYSPLLFYSSRSLFFFDSFNPTLNLIINQSKTKHNTAQHNTTRLKTKNI